jgi:hypothetical protein
MIHTIRCECGTDVSVSEGAAGTVVPCSCGRAIPVPSLAELKRQSGLSAVSTALIVEDLLAKQELPTVMTCASCTGASDETVTVTAECEKAWSQKPSLIAILYFGAWALLPGLLRQEKEYGNNLFLHLRVRICRTCRQRLMHDRLASVLAIVALLFVIAGVAIMVFWTVWGALLFVGAIFPLAMKAILWHRRQTVFKKMLSHEPIYQQLLIDYPDARLVLNTD